MPLPNTIIPSSNKDFQPLLNHLVYFYNNQLENRLSVLSPGQYTTIGSSGMYNVIADVMEPKCLIKPVESSTMKVYMGQNNKAIDPFLYENIIKLDEFLNEHAEEFENQPIMSFDDMAKHIEKLSQEHEVKDITYNLRNYRNIMNETNALSNKEALDEMPTIGSIPFVINQTIFDRLIVEQQANLFRKIKEGKFDNSENSNDRKALQYCFKCGLDNGGDITGQTQALGVVHDITRFSPDSKNPRPNVSVQSIEELSKEMVEAIIDGTPVKNPWLKSLQTYFANPTQKLGMGENINEDESVICMSNSQRKEFYKTENDKANNLYLDNSKKVRYEYCNNYKNTTEYKSKIAEFALESMAIYKKECNLLQRHKLTGFKALFHNGYVFNRKNRINQDRKSIIAQHNNLNKQIIALQLNVTADEVKFDRKTNSFVVYTLDKDEPVKVFSTVWGEKQPVPITNEKIKKNIINNVHVNIVSNDINQKIATIEKAITDNQISLSKENKLFLESIKGKVSSIENRKGTYLPQKQVDGMEALDNFLSFSSNDPKKCFNNNTFTEANFKKFQEDVKSIAVQTEKNYLENNHTISPGAARTFATELLKTQDEITNLDRMTFKTESDYNAALVTNQCDLKNLTAIIADDTSDNIYRVKVNKQVIEKKVLAARAEETNNMINPSISQQQPNNTQQVMNQSTPNLQIDNSQQLPLTITSTISEQNPIDKTIVQKQDDKANLVN